MDKTSDVGTQSFPGRVVQVPDHVRYVVFAMFGIQARTEGAAAAHVAALGAHLAAGSASLVERSHYIDGDGYRNDVFMAYWLDLDGYRTWSAQPEVATWWANLPQDGASDVGFWREVLMPDKDRFQFGAAGDQKAASANFLELKPCDKFGYWGGYRDRLAASTHDDFMPSEQTLAAPTVRETKGRRLSVTTPDNMCFLREGQGWADCGAEERAIWNAQMEDVVSEWVGFLGGEPEESGCMSIRDCREQEVATGDDVDRRSQFAYLLSLEHIERAARTQPTHLAVRDTFLKMFDEMTFEPQMHIWVEVSILKAGEFEDEYVNCHPRTGLLPYFEVEDVVAVTSGAA